MPIYRCECTSRCFQLELIFVPRNIVNITVDGPVWWWSPGAGDCSTWSRPSTRAAPGTAPPPGDLPVPTLMSTPKIAGIYQRISVYNHLVLISLPEDLWGTVGSMCPMTTCPAPGSLVTMCEAGMRRSTEMTAATPGNQPISILKQGRNLSIFITVHWTTVDSMQLNWYWRVCLKAPSAER